MNTLKLVALLLLLVPSNSKQDQQIKISRIEFFGSSGLAIDTLKATLPLHEEQQLAFHWSLII